MFCMPLMYCKRQSPFKIKHAVTDCKSSDLYNTLILRDYAGIKPLPLISPPALNNSMSVQDYQV